MTIEAQLAELIDINKQILAALQSGVQMSATLESTVDEGGKRKRRTKAEIEADKAAEEAAKNQLATEVTHFVNEDQKLTLQVQPGEPLPLAGNGFVKVDAATYATKQAEFAPKAAPAATTQAAASTEPSATAQAASASAQTSGDAEPSWDDAVSALKDLHANPAHGAAGVKALIVKLLPTATNVKDLNGKVANSVIVAEVKALLNTKADDDDIFA